VELCPSGRLEKFSSVKGEISKLSHLLKGGLISSILAIPEDKTVSIVIIIVFRLLHNSRAHPLRNFYVPKILWAIVLDYIHAEASSAVIMNAA